MKALFAAFLLAGLVVVSRVCDGDAGPGVRERFGAIERSEPTVEDLRAVAVRHAGFAPERRVGWSRRARIAGLLPQLTARVARSFQRTEDAPTSSHPDGYALDYRHDLAVEVRAVWDLPRLIFDRSEITASREGARLALERAQLEAEVTRLYYQRRRAQLEWIIGPPANPVDLARRSIEMEELTAILDALTGGWLTRELARTSEPR